MTFQSNYKNLLSRKNIRKYLLNGSHFVQASMCWRWPHAEQRAKILILGSDQENPLHTLPINGRMSDSQGSSKSITKECWFILTIWILVIIKCIVILLQQIRFLQITHNRYPIPHPWGWGMTREGEVWGVYCELKHWSFYFTFVIAVIYVKTFHVKLSKISYGFQLWIFFWKWSL